MNSSNDLAQGWSAAAKLPTLDSSPKFQVLPVYFFLHQVLNWTDGSAGLVEAGSRK